MGSLDRDVKRRERPRSEPILIVAEHPEQEVLSPDVVVVMDDGVLLSTDNTPPAWF